MANLKALQERRERLAKSIQDHAKTQAKWNAEDRQKWDRLNAAYDKNLAELKQEQAIKAELEKRGIVTGNSNRIGRDGGTLAISGNNLALALHGWLMHGDDELRDRVTDQHRNAAKAIGVNLASNRFTIKLNNSQGFKQIQASHPHARGHREGVFRNAMSVGDPATGGVTVGSTLMTTLEKAMLDFSGVMQVADVIRTSTGEPIEFITADDTSNTGSRVGENQDAGTATDPSMGRTRLTSFDFTSGMLYVSRTLLRDSVINLETELGNMLGERLGRKQNTDYTTGGGGGLAPQGIVTASALGVTAASATALLWDEIIDLEHAVDPSRRNLPGVGYMLNDAIVKYIRKLKDGNGLPIWQAGWNEGAPDTINARPFWINQAMDSTISSGKKTMLFGQFSMFKIRQVGDVTIQRLIERRAEFNQDVFIAYQSGDSALVNPGDDPIVHLVH